MISPSTLIRLATAALLIGGVGVARAESLCGDTVPEPGSGTFFAAFTTDASGAGDGTIGIHFPDATAGTEFSYVVTARVHFEDVSVTWSTAPLDANLDGFAEWFADVPESALVIDEQYDYVSALDIRVDLYVDGVFEARVAVPSARVAFAPGSAPLVMLPHEALELAPFGVWNAAAEAREGVIDASLVRPPPRPTEVDDGPHQEDAQ